jgi:hypothetical protein
LNLLGGLGVGTTSWLAHDDLIDLEQRGAHVERELQSPGLRFKRVEDGGFVSVLDLTVADIDAEGR